MAILPKEYLSFVDVACYLNGKGMGYIVGNSYDMNMLSHDLWDLISEDKLQPYIYCASTDYNFQSINAHFPISINLVHQLLKKENVISIDSIPTVGNNKESLYIKLIEPLELSFYELRFKRKELDKLFSNEKEKDDKTINELNQRIKQLEQQLEQASQQLEYAKANQLPEGQGDTLLILGAVMESIKEVAKPNYTQESLINAILAKYGNTSGISESTLKKKFPEAKSYLKQRFKP